MMPTSVNLMWGSGYQSRGSPRACRASDGLALAVRPAGRLRQQSQRPTAGRSARSAVVVRPRRLGSTTWMQTIGTVLVAIKQCSPVRMSMPAQGGRSAHRLLYLAAVRRRQMRAGTSLTARLSSQASRLVQPRLPMSERSDLPISVLVAVTTRERRSTAETPPRRRCHGAAADGAGHRRLGAGP